ncbi:sensor histidine kinase [Acanthopleuribacter pedis]|uniref:Histidine kinase n=1 Tax=Acanthopleuribacter pedis TaxID=442870 RepID=A0A8J7Q716_9BACT|nr:histidine kinase [Acanthopleuribacter pedis]MBO1319426.1 histidine kinase [Acanthopleuribacter pedis]
MVFCLVFTVWLFQQPAPMPNQFTEVVDGQVMLTGWEISEAGADAAHPDALPADAWLPIEAYLDQPHPTRGHWWLRTELTLAEVLPAPKFYALCPEGLASATEVYWNGRLMLANGVVSADPTQSRPGRYYEPVPIPAALVRPGTHRIAIRVANHHNQHFWNGAQIIFGPYDDLLKGIAVWQIKVYLVVGVFLMTALLHLGLFFFAAKKPAYLFIGALSFSLGGRLLLENLWVFDTLDTRFYDVQQNWRRHATVLTAWAVTAAVGLQLALPKRAFPPWLVLLPLGYAFPTPDALAALVAVLALLLVLWAGARQRAPAAPVLGFFWIAAALSYVLPIRTGIDALSWLSCWLVFAFNTLTLNRLAKQEREKQAALLRSARLENQMLKGSIKPHFLMNSLTSVLAWMRRDPDTAGELVQALADEFRQLAQIAEHRLISLQEELALCRNHLRIMSLRKGADYRLEAANLPEDATIPPLVLHTLVENGLTHGYEKQRTGVFRLSYDRDARGVHLCLQNDGQSGPADGGEGTGLKYVRARLNESYGSRWRLTSRPDASGWQVCIDIDEPGPPGQRSGTAPWQEETGEPA